MGRFQALSITLMVILVVLAWHVVTPPKWQHVDQLGWTSTQLSEATTVVIKDSASTQTQTQMPTSSKPMQTIEIGLQPSLVSVRVETFCSKHSDDGHLRMLLRVVVEVLDVKEKTIPCRQFQPAFMKPEDIGCHFRLYIRGDETVGGKYLTPTNNAGKATPFEYEGYVSLRMPAADVTVEVLLDNVMDPNTKPKGIKYDVYNDALLVSDPHRLIPVGSTTDCNGSVGDSPTVSQQPLSQCSFKDGRSSHWSPLASWVKRSALNTFGLDSTTRGDAIDTIGSALVWVPSSCSLRPVTPADFTAFVGGHLRVDISVIGASRMRETKNYALDPLIKKLDPATRAKFIVHYVDPGQLVRGEYRPTPRQRRDKHLDANDMITPDLKPIHYNGIEWLMDELLKRYKQQNNGISIIFFSTAIWENRGFADAVKEFPDYIRTVMEYITKRASEIGSARLVWIVQPVMHLWHNSPNNPVVPVNQFYDVRARDGTTNDGANISERRLIKMNEAGRKIAIELGWRVVDGEGLTRARRLACRDTVHYNTDVYEAMMHSMLRAAMEE